MATFNYTVDDEPQETSAHVLTPVQIMEAAQVDPLSHYLVQLEGQHQVSYQDKPNDEIHMHNHLKFISISTGPTPVS
jgi:hypothetical protein